MKKKIKKIKKIPVKKKKKIERKEIKPQKLKINFDCQKTLKVAFIVSALLLSFSVLYYYVFFLPTIEKEKLEQQKEFEQLKLSQGTIENKIKNETEDKQKEESKEISLADCLNTAKEAYSEVFEKAIESCNAKENNKEKYDCTSILLSETQKGLEESQAECLKNDEIKDESSITNP
ncbi:MAG: hypothetical protein NTU58_03910 [Candidatus Nealsonbacteria bacterium]|nr:hypothetical protein [Candidatus Nealsonbacteria bacterium]